MKWQLCPKCLGEARVPNNGTSSSTFETCSVCNGERIIPEIPESTPEDAIGQDELWVTLMRGQIKELEKYEGKLESAKDFPLTGSIVLMFKKSSYWIKIEKMSIVTID